MNFYIEFMDNVQEHALIRELLFDFLRELPLHFAHELTTVREAYALIDNFMKNHGLNVNKLP